MCVTERQSTVVYMALFKLKVSHFRCACRMHNEGNAIDSLQVLLYRS